MTDSENKIDVDETREVLASVEKAESYGLSHTLPPRWFGVAIALINGGLVAVAAAGKTTLVALLIAALAGVIASRQRNMKAYPTQGPKNAVGVLAAIGLIAFGIALIFGAKLLVEIYAFTFAPLASGAVMATVIYLLSISERREYLRKIKTGSAE